MSEHIVGNDSLEELTKQIDEVTKSKLEEPKPEVKVVEEPKAEEPKPEVVKEEPKAPVVEPPTDEKKYKEIWAWNTRVSQENATLKKEIETVKENLKKLSEKPVDMAEVMKDPSKFESLLAERETKIKSENAAELKKYKDEQNLLMLELYEARMERDTVNHPRWNELKGTMDEIVNDPNCPIDFTRPAEQIYNALYKLAEAKIPKVTDTVKIKEEAKKEVEEEMRREARTTTATGVAGGNKGRSTSIDTSKMSVEEMRDQFKKMSKNK